MASLRSVTVEGAELADLLFGQQHLGSRDFFKAALGQSHTVPLSAFPHLAFISDPDNGRDVFDDYLNQSWSFRQPKSNTPEARRRHLERFLERKLLVERGVHREDPILVYRRRDGRYVIVDGNHRAAIALALGHSATLRILSTRQWLTETALESGAFFGSGHRGMPYQSLFDGDREIVKGRRRDTVARMNMVLPQHIRGQRVLDLGSNIGATAFIAADGGAKWVVGLEVDPKIVVSAIKLNSYFASDVDFYLHDLNEPFRLSGGVDTVFCFSVAAHVDTLKGLERTIQQSGAKVMYFEGHAGATADDYPTLMTNDIFRSVDLIAYNASGDPDSTRKRPFFKCVAHTSS